MTIPVSTGLTIPDNVPSDVLKAVQQFLDDASSADATGGGIAVYGLYLLSEREELHFSGCSGKFLQDAVVEAITISATMDKIMGGKSCSCPECRPATKTDDKAVPNLLSRIFGRGK
ncbi:MAG: hypothetical protein QM647_15220 [Asticcacaulis sp.]|uniref:hypothetical protein n=1 Tax=Asticcacaulis sp. TaxID=1872648 RepID=UPI0039E467EC